MLRFKTDLFTDFFETVLLDGISSYHKVEQHGIRQGFTLHDHIFNDCMVIEELKDVWQLSDLEEKIALSAFAVHDINKVVNCGMLWSEIATYDNVRKLLNDIKVLSLWPELEAYIKDITYLVANHSEKHQTTSSMLSGSKLGLQLQKRRLDEIKELIQAADIIGLSESLDEQHFKDKVLRHINNVAAQQYQLIEHRLAEHRGILSNIIHNATSSYLKSEFSCVPLWVYPEGIVYLAPLGMDQKSISHEAIIKEASRSLGEVMARDVKVCAQSASKGVMADIKAPKLIADFDELWGAMTSLVEKRVGNRLAKAGPPRNEEVLKKLTEKAENDLKDETKLKEYLKFLNQTCRDVFTEEAMLIAELMRTYYHLLRKLIIGGDDTDLYWKRIREVFMIPDKVLEQALYVGDKTAYAPHFLAKFLYENREMDSNAVFEIIAQDVREDYEQIAEKANPLKRYILQNLSIADNNYADRQEFEEDFNHYINNDNKCSICGSSYFISEWRKTNVNGSTKIQFYSNLISNLNAPPNRYICQTCAIEMMLQKVLYKLPSNAEAAYYLHLYPKRAHRPLLLKAFRETFNRVSDKLNVSKFEFSELKENNMDAYKAMYKDKKSKSGVHIPTHERATGGVMTLLLQPPVGKKTFQFLYVLQQAIIWQQAYGLKVMVSRSPIPSLSNDQFQDLYLENMSLYAKGLLSSSNLAQEEIKRLVTDIRCLHSIADKVMGKTKDYDERDRIFFSLLNSLSKDRRSVFVVADKAIRRNTKSSKNMGEISHEILDDLIRLAYGGKCVMNDNEIIRQLAEMAIDSKIKKKEYSRDSLLFPIRTIYKNLKNKKSYNSVAMTVNASTQQIYDNLKRTASKDYKPKDTKFLKIRTFVDTFHNQLLNDIYQGDLKALIRDEKMVESAYLCHLRSYRLDKESEGEIK